MSRVDILRKFLKQVGPNKRVRWRKKAVNLKRVGLLLVEFQKIVPNKQVGWKICLSSRLVYLAPKSTPIQIIVNYS